MKINITIVAFSIAEEKLVISVVGSRLPQSIFKKQKFLDDAAERICKKQIGISLYHSYIEQLYTFDGVIVSYLVLVSPQRLTTTQNASWTPYNTLRLSQKEQEIVQYAKQRLQWKLEYTNVAYSLLPKKFTLSELQRVYEIILGKKLDKRNFRKKILSLKLLSDTNKKRKDVGHRPAKLYRFTKHEPVIVEVL